MRTCYVLYGLPGSGKSTWANKMDLPIVCRDTIRLEMGLCKGDEKTVGTREQEMEVTKISDNMMMLLCEKAQDFIVDATNIRGCYRVNLCKNLRGYGYKIIFVKFDTPLWVCVERRKDQIPEHVIKNMYHQMKDPSNLISNSEYDEIVMVSYNYNMRYF